MICPTPDKRCFRDAESAKYEASRIGIHSYHCECGWWHLSKQRPSEFLMKINAPPAEAEDFDIQ